MWKATRPLIERPSCTVPGHNDARDQGSRIARAARLRVPPDAGPGARFARRGRGVPHRPRAPDADRGLGVAEPVRRLPRGAVRTVEARLRPVAADEVPVVRRARRAWLSGSRGAPRQEPARHGRGRAPGRSPLPRRARAARRRRAAAIPGRGGPVGARGRAARARASPNGAEAAAGAARTLRGARLPKHRLRGAAPAHEPALALGPALPGAGAGGRPRRACRARGGRCSARPGSRGGALVRVVGRRGRRKAPRGRPPGEPGAGVAGGAVIRELRREDAQAVAALHLAVSPHQFETAERVWFWASRGLEREQWGQWVAEEDGEIVGSAWAAFEWSSPTPGRGRFWIAVPADRRGRGIGGALYEVLDRYLRARGAWRARTNVEGDPDGEQFVRSRGFERGGADRVSVLDLREADLPEPQLPSGFRLEPLGRVRD